MYPYHSRGEVLGFFYFQIEILLSIVLCINDPHVNRSSGKYRVALRLSRERKSRCSNRYQTKRQIQELKKQNTLRKKQTSLNEIFTTKPIGIVLGCTKKFDRTIVGGWSIDNWFSFGIIDHSTRIEKSLILWIPFIYFRDRYGREFDRRDGLPDQSAVLL